jgi:UDP-glucose 4-epimerase
MRCLVTGGAGFIGSHLCRELIGSGHEVVCMDNLSSGSLGNLPQEAEFVFGDANTEDLARVFQDTSFDWVFHYAATVGVKRTLANEAQVWKDLNGAKNVADLCMDSSVKRLVYASSSEVYGNSLPVKKESHFLIPRLPYGHVKKEAEEYMRKHHEENGLPYTALRFFNAYGPRQDTNHFVVGIFVDSVMKGKNLVIHGDGKQTRDFVYIDDNIKATLKALKTRNAIGQAINIGSGKATTVLSLANKVLSLSDKKAQIEFAEPPHQDVRHRVADITRLKELVGFVPEYTLHAGLKKTIEHYAGKANIVCGSTTHEDGTKK